MTAFGTIHKGGDLKEYIERAEFESFFRGTGMEKIVFLNLFVYESHKGDPMPSRIAP